MGDIVPGTIGARVGGWSGCGRSGCGRYVAQETGEPPDSPDVERPPDQDLPHPDKPQRETPNGPGAPPFTGEDVEDEPPRKRDRPLPM